MAHHPCGRGDFTSDAEEGPPAGDSAAVHGVSLLGQALPWSGDQELRLLVPEVWPRALHTTDLTADLRLAFAPGRPSSNPTAR